MGCSTSSQTSAVDTTRPSSKPEETNGTATTGAANENGNIAEDSETLPDQTPAASSDVKPAEEAPAAATPADSTAAAPPAGEELQPPAASPPAEADAAAAPPAESTNEAAASSPEPAPAPPEPEKAETSATDAEPKTEDTPAPSE